MGWSQGEFAERLESAIRARGWTQREFASRMNAGEGTVSNWKTRQDATPSIHVLLQAAELLERTPCWLAFGDEFVAMDDEERTLIEAWRKMSEPERNAFSGTFQAITAGRDQSKTPGKRTKRAKPAVVYPAGELLSHAPVPLTRSQAEQALQGLKAHMVTLLRESKEYECCKAAGIALRQLIVLLPAKSKADLLLAVLSQNQGATPTLFPEQHSD